MTLSLRDLFVIERGTLQDYARLARFHYRSGHPGAATSVFRMVLKEPTIAGRFFCVNHGDCTNREVVGVLVRSLPSLACTLRDIATRNRYADLAPRERGIALNREVRTISRVVIDPRVRGLGLAVKLVKHALAHGEDGVIYTEALAAMGRVSPFFEQAGMLRYDRPPRHRAAHARLMDALEHVLERHGSADRRTHGADASYACVFALSPSRLSNLSESDRAFLLHELRRWQRAAQRTPRAELESMTFEDLVRRARRELLARPVYYLMTSQQIDSCPPG